MKVLFAVNDENISKTIVKQYQKDYKEIITSKNVYYFNAILKELQLDKSYDRIVISEDLEPFANNNYDIIDKFIFEKLDNISDEAVDKEGKDTSIILIATDRRAPGNEMLVKLFGIGVYSALLGKDRSIENVCSLIKQPRTKKEAKDYYKVDSEDINYQSENESHVSETEIQNILSHYKKLGKSEEKYAQSFDNIVSQYTDTQLKVIIKFLPLNVKAVLEAESPKYQELIMQSSKQKTRKPEIAPHTPENSSYTAKKSKNATKINPSSIRIDMLETKTQLTRPVVVPSEFNVDKVKKMQPEMTTMPEEIEESVGGRRPRRPF
ncbi:MAG: hypothetical protein LBL91_06020 [Lachnospiraceae bacterium]|jgi:hypothetical protein|nr:hypothetical protein [Lachnospiraceae bacterium]